MVSHPRILNAILHCNTLHLLNLDVAEAKSRDWIKKVRQTDGKDQQELLNGNTQALLQTQKPPKHAAVVKTRKVNQNTDVIITLLLYTFFKYFPLVPSRDQSSSLALHCHSCRLTYIMVLSHT